MLPEGYPNSVTSDYLEYSLWRGIQGVASQISGVLATQSLLYAVGLGRGAIPTADAINWVLKDGIGYLSKIVLSKYGRHFDLNPKGWRLFADLLENATFGLEILTPAFPNQFVFIGAVAGAGRSAAALIQVDALKETQKDKRVISDDQAKATDTNAAESTSKSEVVTMENLTLMTFICKKMRMKRTMTSFDHMCLLSVTYMYMPLHLHNVKKKSVWFQWCLLMCTQSYHTDSPSNFFFHQAICFLTKLQQSSSLGLRLDP